MPPEKTRSANPYAKRRNDTERKLRAALERLIKGLPTHPDLKGRRYRLNVAALAKESRIARSAIYANHQAVLDALHDAAGRSTPNALLSWQDKLAEQSAVIAQLKSEQRFIITENAALLKRALDAEAEAASLRRRNARLLVERDRALEPITLAPLRGGKVAAGGG